MKFAGGKYFSIITLVEIVNQSMFTGDETWIYYFARPWGTMEDEPFNPDNFVAQPIVKTTIGTTPEGSEWAKVNLPSELVGK